MLGQSGGYVVSRAARSGLRFWRKRKRPDGKRPGAAVLVEMGESNPRPES